MTKKVCFLLALVALLVFLPWGVVVWAGGVDIRDRTEYAQPLTTTSTVIIKSEPLGEETTEEVVCFTSSIHPNSIICNESHGNGIGIFWVEEGDSVTIYLANEAPPYRLRSLILDFEARSGTKCLWAKWLLKTANPPIQNIGEESILLTPVDSIMDDFLPIVRIGFSDPVTILKGQVVMAQILLDTTQVKKAVVVPPDSAISSDKNSSFSLSNYPNPFNPSTIINFILPSDVRYTFKIYIYNVVGQVVRTYEGLGVSGLNVVTWDGKDGNNRDVSSGIYFCRLTAGNFSAVRKMSLVH